MASSASNEVADSLPEMLSPAELESISESSRPFVGNWHSVVSQTNWEKGRIIHEWRHRLADQGVAARLYSDPAWSRLVGEVTPQHVGRLRRVWERFGETQSSYSGLYWSHFLAALDWDDAEMWLEGAVQSHWSVSKMRYQRWETMGAVESQKPDPMSIVSTVDDEGVAIQPALRPVASDGEAVVSRDELQSVQGPSGPKPEDPDFGDESESGTATDSRADSASGEEDLPLHQGRVDINAILERVPDDVSRPWSELNAALSRYRDQDWDGISRMHVVALVNELRQLLRKTTAPGSGSSND